MAKITFKGQSDYFARLQQLDSVFAKESTIERAVAAGAAPVADEIRRRIESLPEEEFRHLNPGETFSGIPKSQKEDLEKAFGLTPIRRDKKGFVHTKAGFDGYGRHPTKTYPHGVPNALIARATESGSSVRRKHPFVAPAVNLKRAESVNAMEQSIDNDIKKIFKE